MRIIPAIVLAIFYVFAAVAVWAVDITITIVNPGDGVPSAISLNPSSVTILDTGTSGTILSVASVTMSDASTFAGTLASSNASLVGTSGLDAILARDLSASDDGFYNVAISAGTASTTLSVKIIGGTAAPSPPTQATAANLNTCVVCMDFTAPTGGVWVDGAAASGVNAAQTNTWLDCAGASNPIWFHQSNGLNTGVLPCPDIVSDGLGNPQVLRQWNGPLSSSNVNGMKLYTGGRGIMVPTNNYMEATFIVPQFPLHGYIESIWLGGAGEIPSGVHNYLEFDAFEVNTNISAGAYASGAGSWSNGHGDLGANWFGTFPPNYDSYNVTTQYLKVGQRITSDSNTFYKCMWINDVFQNCIHGSPDGNTFLSWQLNDDARSRMQTYFILTGCIQSGCSPGTSSQMVGYAKSFNLWSCANWRTTACRTGSADPGGY